MNDNNITPLRVGDNDAPFAGPDPDEDELVSTRPEADSEIDQLQYYNEGLAGAAELDEDDEEDIDDDGGALPDGFHIE